MLDNLGEELLGEVLRWLPVADLKRARLACRAADAAARTHLAAAASLRLTLDNTAGGGPDWARWPRLVKLTLAFPPEPAAEQHKLVQRLFAPPPSAAAGGARAAPGAISALDLSTSYAVRLEPAVLVKLLAALPGLTALRLTHQFGDEHAAALLRAVAVHAPRLRALDAGLCSMAPAAAAAIDGLRQLQALQLGWLERGATWPVVLAALPGHQLTALSFSQDGLPPPVAALPWPQLRELLGVTLLQKDVAALAAGLPQLQRLFACHEGEWGAIAPAGFERVTHARVQVGDESFYDVSLSTLLPSVQTLAIETYEEHTHGEPDFNLHGLTALSSLRFHCHQGYTPISQSTFAGICALPALAHLALKLEQAMLQQLARLPSSLVALNLTVLLESVNDAHMDINSALLAMAPLSRLTVLHVLFSGLPQYAVAVSQAALSRFVQSLPALRELALRHPPLRLHDVAVLCAHARLRVLYVNLAAGEDAAAFDRLAADCASQGLVLRNVDIRSRSLTPVCCYEWARFKCAA